jgi:NTE family protein
VWDINATTFETGKDFRFNKSRMGDYMLGYVKNPDFPIAEAAASSAGFPMLIGPLKLDASKLNFEGGKSAEPKQDGYYLWDGGVYDNLGLEALYADGKLKGDADFMVCSNAGKTSGYTARRKGITSVANVKRLLDITMDQVYSLRSRDLFDEVISKNEGIYVNIGNTAEAICKKSTIMSDDDKEKLINECLPAKDVKKVRDYATTLMSPNKADYGLILRHGYENAKGCWEAYIQ